MIDLCALIYIVYVHIEIHVLLKHLSLFLISDYESNILLLYNNFQILKALIINIVIFINYLNQYRNSSIHCFFICIFPYIGFEIRLYLCKLFIPQEMLH